MSRLKRVAWILAWGAWIWCGVGLSRELPRELKASRHVPLDRGEQVLGFLHDSDVLVTQQGSSGPLRLRCWTASNENGPVEWRGPLAEGRSFAVSLRHGVALGVRDAWREGVHADSLQALDLRTGHWTPMSVRANRVFDFHSSKPWAVVASDDERPAPEIAILDARTGMGVAVRRGRTPPEQCRDYVADCYFQGDDLLVVIQRDRGPDAFTAKVEKWLEKWRADGGVGAPVALEAGHLETSRPAGGRMLLRAEWGAAQTVAVVDCESGASLFIDASARENNTIFENLNGSTVPRGPRLSRSGRTVMLANGSLWGVDGKRRRWAPASLEAAGRLRADEFVLRPSASGDVFLVDEQWRPALENWGLKWTGTTAAVRDFDTGAVRSRVCGRHPWPDHCSSDGRFGVGDEGTVYHLPAKPNWMLVAVCQAILGAPLLLVWAALGWRRRHLNRRRMGG